MGNFESGFTSDDPMYWKEVHDKIGFETPPDQDTIIKSALASEAFIAEMIENDTSLLIRKSDGTIERRGEKR